MFVALAIAVASLELAPVTASVHAAPSIPAALVEDVLREAAAIWRPSGVAFVWRTIRDEAPAAPVVDDGTLPRAVALRVDVDDGATTVKNYVGALGSIVFTDRGALPDIRLSYANALWLLRDAYGEGNVNRMTTVERRTHLSRALGRALAHEIGHYVLASREHTPGGLMKAKQLAGELFGPSRRAFAIDDAQRCEALARLHDVERLADR